MWLKQDRPKSKCKQHQLTHASSHERLWCEGIHLSRAELHSHISSYGEVNPVQNKKKNDKQFLVSQIRLHTWASATIHTFFHIEE